MNSANGPAAIREFDAMISAWAASQDDILAVALVGSYVRGTATPTSDIDLVILTAHPERYLQDPAWVGNFGKVIHQQVEDWGKLTSLRVWYADRREVEFGLTTPDWVAAPLDEGTAQVIAGGIKLLFERDGYLSSRIELREV